MSSVDHMCFWWVRVCWGARVMDANISGTPPGSAPDNFVRCSLFLFSQENSFVIMWWKADVKRCTAELYQDKSWKPPTP
jgi:hypothetical protein